MAQKLDRYHRADKSAQFVMKEDGEIVWREETKYLEFDRTFNDWVKTETTTADKTPEQLGYLKVVEFDIITVVEIPSTKKIKLKEKLLFKEHVKASVRSDFPNMWLVLGDDKKFYLKEIQVGLCMQLPLNESTEYAQLQKSEEEPIKVDEAREILKKWNYTFGGKDDDGIYKVRIGEE